MTGITIRAWFEERRRRSKIRILILRMCDERDPVFRSAEQELIATGEDSISSLISELERAIRNKRPFWWLCAGGALWFALSFWLIEGQFTKDPGVGAGVVIPGLTVAFGQPPRRYQDVRTNA